MKLQVAASAGVRSQIFESRAREIARAPDNAVDGILLLKKQLR